MLSDHSQFGERIPENSRLTVCAYVLRCGARAAVFGPPSNALLLFTHYVKLYLMRMPATGSLVLQSIRACCIIAEPKREGDSRVESVALLVL